MLVQVIAASRADKMILKESALLQKKVTDQFLNINLK